MDNLLDFTNDKETSFAPLPEGMYAVCVDDIQIKDNKAGTGKYVSAKLRVFDGEYKQRFLFATFNIQHQSEKAMLIGRGQFKSFLIAAKMPPDVKDILDVAGAKVIASVKIEVRDGFEPQNRVSYFKPYEATPGAPAAPTGGPSGDGLSF